MTHLARAVRMLAIASIGAALRASLAAQGAPPPSPPSFKFSGYAEASYSYSTQAVADAIVGRLYDRYSDAFMLNALKLTVDRPFVATKLDAGVHADVLLGQNAQVLQSTGFSLGNNGDVTQLYVTLNVPTKNGNGIQFKAGKMVTMMGLEVIEEVANPNWSEGNQFVYVENFTSTGLEIDYKLSGSLDVEARVDNGWDRVATAGHKDFMARVGIAPSANTALGVVGYTGAQQPGSTASRSGVDVLLNQKFGTASLWVQGDYGMEKANASLPDPTRDAKWWAVGAWLAFDLSPKANLALRGDYLDDQQGARTAAAFGLPGAPEHKVWTGTATLNIKTWSSALVRPEVRYDHSNVMPFNGKSDQVSVALSIAYLF